jgi:hypothetical protein
MDMVDVMESLDQLYMLDWVCSCQLDEWSHRGQTNVSIGMHGVCIMFFALPSRGCHACGLEDLGSFLCPSLSFESLLHPISNLNLQTYFFYASSIPHALYVFCVADYARRPLLFSRTSVAVIRFPVSDLMPDVDFFLFLFFLFCLLVPLLALLPRLHSSHS